MHKDQHLWKIWPEDSNMVKQIVGRCPVNKSESGMKSLFHISVPGSIYFSTPFLRGIFMSAAATDSWIVHWFDVNCAQALWFGSLNGSVGKLGNYLAFCSGDGDGGGISVDALACSLFQNICNVPRHVPSKGCSEIFEQTRSITQLSTSGFPLVC